MLDKGKSGNSATLPLGPQRLSKQVDSMELKTVVDEALDALPWLCDVRGRALYAVGGALRAVARIHMSQSRYPLHVIHQYRLDRRTARDFAELLSRQSRSSLRRVGGVSRQRADVLPVASFILARIVRRFRPDKVVFSAHGLREGLLYEGLAKDRQKADPLVASYKDMEQRESRFPGFGPDLAIWTDGLFVDEPESLARLRHAACHLSDVGWRVHSDFREGQAFRRILRAPFSSIDHPGRAFVALSVYARYRGGVDGSSANSARTILDEATVRRAHVLGLAMRLGYVLAGGAPGLLVESKLRVEDDSVVLILDKASQPLRGETLERRLNALAKALGLKPAIEIEL
jgi:exopolyphosphatase/guanosine-5'-triphosphate,3'-diphosphate pyrophosphatase